jgi:glycerate dehydrogenase
VRGVILDADSFDWGDLDTAALDDCLESWVSHRFTRAAQIPERVAGFEVIVTNKVVIDA